MKPLPIRLRVALSCAALTGAAVACFAGGTLFNLYQEQIEAADLELESKTAHLGHLLVSDEPSVERLADLQELIAEPWIALAIFNVEGRLEKSGDGLPDAVAVAALPPGTSRTVRHESRSWRVRATAVEKQAVVAAYDLSEVHQIVGDLLIAYALSLPFVALVAGLGAWWVAGRALAPVRAVTAAAAAITPARLDQRVPSSPVDDDVGRLAGVLNDMLARLETSFRQAERFAADASHELRTPLTIMAAEIDALLRGGGLTPEGERRLVSVQEEIARLTRIAENLLLLARFDAGEARLAHERVDLSALVQEACDDAGLLADAHGVAIESELAAGVAIVGDRDLLRRMLLNLLGNAAKFNAPGGRVRCVLSAADRDAIVAIANTGPGIAPEMQARLFQRFFRADAARTHAHEGNGLGLALCREIARAHAGEISLNTAAAPGWTEFVVRLSLASVASAAAPARRGVAAAP